METQSQVTIVELMSDQITCNVKFRSAARLIPRGLLICTRYRSKTRKSFDKDDTDDLAETVIPALLEFHRGYPTTWHWAWLRGGFLPVAVENETRSRCLFPLISVILPTAQVSPNGHRIQPRIVRNWQSFSGLALSQIYESH